MMEIIIKIDIGDSLKNLADSLMRIKKAMEEIELPESFLASEALIMPCGYGSYRSCIEAARKIAIEKAKAERDRLMGFAISEEFDIDEEEREARIKSG